MYKPHQIAASDRAAELLTAHNLAAIWGLPRTGKTRAAIRAVELRGLERVLVLTKKAAIPGWQKELAETKPKAVYTVTNYEQAKKLAPNFDVLILDESHNLGSRGKPTQRVKDIRKLCYHLPLLLLSGTPTIETPLSIYHQMAVTKHSLFNSHRNFYSFFREYGVADPIWIGGRSVESYKKHKEKLIAVIESIAVRIDQDQAGIVHKASDTLHVVPLAPKTLALIDALKEDGVADDLVFDSDIGVRAAIHQIEAGAVLFDDKLRLLENAEVVDYLADTFGDSTDVVYLSHYRSTRAKLAERFKKARLLSSIGDAEGVDLSDAKHLVVVNTGYSGAKFAQLRERGVNLNRKTPAVVHHITTTGGLSGEVYSAVSEKKDFNLRAFRNFRAANTVPHS